MDRPSEDSTKKTRSATDTSLEVERGRTDDALSQEAVKIAAEEKKNVPLSPEARDKENEDETLAKERLRLRLVGAALFELERQETDTSLRYERSDIDALLARKSDLLVAEKAAHELTRAALSLRDTYIAVASHDLRSPLGVIIGSANLIEDGLRHFAGDASSLLNEIERIKRNAGYMDRIIGDTLDAERIENGKLTLILKKCDICALLQECKELFTPIATKKSISMTIQSSAEPVFANIDHDRMLQVLSNLVGNAIKFSPSKGAVILGLKKKAVEIEISVADSGPGIPKDKKLRIFEKFAQLETNHARGLGLGLFISKWLIEAHKGHIWVDSVVGKGSTFTFTLPIG